MPGLWHASGHDFTELIADRTRDFTGREWVFAEVEAWLADPDGKRIFFLSGGPGSGKSAVAARLVQIARGEVPADPCPALAQTGLAYFHFCQAQDETVIEPVGFVKSLSLSLAGRYPAFALALVQSREQRPEIHVHQTVGEATDSEITAVKIENLEVGSLSARKAFAHLVREPLEKLVQDGETGPIIFLVDALDEALTFDPDENLATMLADVTDDPRDLPKQVRFLVTSRPDPRVVDLFRRPETDRKPVGVQAVPHTSSVEDLLGWSGLDLIDDAPGNQKDVQDYAERRLAPILTRYN